MKAGVKQRIYLGFFTLISIFIISAVISSIILNKNKEKVKEISEVIDPSLQTINDFNLLVTESKMLVTNWVYLQSNQIDKDELKDLHQRKYPVLKQKLNKQKEQWADKILAKVIDSVFFEFENLLEVEKTVMKQLVTFDNYEDPMVKIECEGLIENEILPKSQHVMDRLKKILLLKQKEKAIYQNNLVASSGNLTITLMVLSIVLVVVGIIISVLMVQSIIKPINTIKDMINGLGRGELRTLKLEIRNDEIGDMATSVKNLTEGLRNTATFSNNIGQGIFDSDFEPLSDQDVLGISLMGMRDNLRKVSEEDAQRNWATEGLAKFADILRSNDKDLETLTYHIISNLVKYVEANQGGLFLINDENSNDIFLEMNACYAYEKRKFINARIEIGEGLIGQCIIEKDIIFITDIPEDYVNITSGLGESSPTCILIVPMKTNDEIYGVIELASFNTFRQFEIDFVDKLAQSIASTISSVKNNTKTKKLLEQSQLQAEQMRSQEEEMRQNMEELQATQEEIVRTNSEYKVIINEKDKEIRKLLNMVEA